MHRIVVAAALLLALPSAYAMTLEVEGPTAPLQPETAYPLTLHVVVECTAVLASPAMEPRINVSVDAEGVAVDGPASIAADRQDCAGNQEITVQFDYQLSALDGTLAEEPLPIHFTAALDNAESETATVEVEVAYVGEFDAVVVADHKAAAPQKEIPFEVEIRNLANARTLFTFHAAQLPKQGHLVLPSEVFLEPAGHGTSSILVVVQYVTPFENGPNEASEDLFIEIRSESAKNGAPGENATVELTADTKGFYVPSGAWLPALALGGALLARRRL